MSLVGKSVLMIIASNNFRDEEYLHPREVLENEGAKITIASSTKKEATGMLGTKVVPDILIDEVNIDDYDAVIFVGGSGANEYWENEKAHEIAKKAYEKSKVIGAICIAPVTLARAGLLKGKKATVYTSEIENIKKEGAIYTGNSVEVDGKIVTGNGPTAAKEFGEKIAELLK
ncbi:MAG: DJ-1/PfpI family protein [Caldisericia bacterium]|nr:DJ-1/PfpI family protein [Caldisericia bacterium]MDD5689105.1 DJ-1/PfpI family protein [Caldisericia bacterium]HOJ15679.1 DJ-1/PfpI family protein [Caldisericia bacterium]HOW02683.1 DJ-1/PfpI family protein [Caldisericia bacterium]HPO28520.1 DJ-1/PfpI family protein [Caldisericia bacterium]